MTQTELILLYLGLHYTEPLDVQNQTDGGQVIPATMVLLKYLRATIM
jgi:hypothetical protein